jgi:hypothetical protein
MLISDNSALSFSTMHEKMASSWVIIGNTRTGVTSKHGYFVLSKPLRLHTSLLFSTIDGAQLSKNNGEIGRHMDQSATQTWDTHCSHS